MLPEERTVPQILFKGICQSECAKVGVGKRRLSPNRQGTNKLLRWVDSDSGEILKINWQQTNLLLYIGLGFADEQRPKHLKKIFCHEAYLALELRIESRQY